MKFQSYDHFVLSLSSTVIQWRCNARAVESMCVMMLDTQQTLSLKWILLLWLDPHSGGSHCDSQEDSLAAVMFHLHLVHKFPAQCWSPQGSHMQ